MKRRPYGILGAAIAGSLLLAGCSASPAPTASAPSVSASASASASALGNGFHDPENLPAPEGTLSPSPGSWDGVRPPAGFRAVLLRYGNDAQTSTLVSAVQSWAADEDVQLTEVEPSSPKDIVPSIHEAMETQPDLIVSAGEGLVDALAAVTAGYLAQDFLIVGAEIAEPTANVTSVDWTGAGFRGEGLGSSTEYDPETFTEERAARALRAGVAAVLNDLTGFVVWVD